ncbi:NUDIX domain-containing protein [Streptomyces sp. NPDC060209]|uniref:NUDIX domain-containing protein n=1 Tax=Streptomyces sp. NPDC060209 TaxID=3347073 RepID=UPI00365DCF04
MNCSNGGHVAVGETSLPAAARELEEEAGIAVPIADLRQVGAFDAQCICFSGCVGSPPRPCHGDAPAAG